MYKRKQVGRILGELDRLGLREKTASVFTSDHGYHLGEHTFWQKSNLHEEVTRVPLVISMPGLNPGRSSSLVELVDLFPTLSAAAGLQAPGDLHGTSLLPILKDPGARVKESALSIHGSGTSMRTAQWTYTRYKDGSEELYDMENDPGQFTNRARVKESEQALAIHRRAFDKRLRAAGLNPTKVR